MSEERNKLKRQARKNLKNYHARKSQYDKAGEVLLKKAEADHEQRQRQSRKDTEALCTDVAQGIVAMVRGRVYSIGGVGPGKKHSCFVCGDRGGTFYFINGKYYGQCCKHLANASTEEIEEERKAICH